MVEISLILTTFYKHKRLQTAAVVAVKIVSQFKTFLPGKATVICFGSDTYKYVECRDREKERNR